MITLVHDLITESAKRFPARPALKYHDGILTYAALHAAMTAFAAGLMKIGLKRANRVAVYAEKRFETVIGMFGAVRAGGVYVPINPLLKAEQVAYILNRALAVQRR